MKAFEVKPRSTVNSVVFFGSEKCPTCKALQPALHRLAKLYKLNVYEYYIETDSEEFVRRDVMGVPTLVLTDKNGKKIGWFVGHQTETSLENNLKKYGAI